MRHRNLPIFIPHLGCPHQCVFCNQHSISGCAGFCEDAVEGEIQRGLASVPAGSDTEIAFFGGSFTGIPREQMCRLLETAERFVRAGQARSIRISTRPDYISAEILKLLSGYSVRHIELGLQSMDDEVLRQSQRGHTALDAERACYAVREAGFSLTGQMMIGLPASTREKELFTAQCIAKMGADTARIYPTVVFRGTPLCQMTLDGRYQPLSVRDAVERSADALELLESRGVSCIRIGLCATEALVSPQEVLAGPNHPALGELVRSEVCFRDLCRQVREEQLNEKKTVLRCPAAKISVAIGQHRCNAERLFRTYGTRIIRVERDDSLTEPRLQAL